MSIAVIVMKHELVPNIKHKQKTNMNRRTCFGSEKMLSVSNNATKLHT